MDSSLSPIIANSNAEFGRDCHSNLQVQPLFYYRYVDDIVLAFPSEYINDTLTIFNSLHTKLQFTMEVGKDNKLNFLDIILIIDNKKIIFDILSQNYIFGRFLNFHSNLFIPLHHKRGIIISFVDKIFLLLYPRFQHNNLVEAIHTFLNNGYPLPFIFSTIENRLKFHIQNFTINILHTIYKSKKNCLQFLTLNLSPKVFHLYPTCFTVN